MFKSLEQSQKINQMVYPDGLLNQNYDRILDYQLLQLILGQF